VFRRVVLRIVLPVLALALVGLVPVLAADEGAGSAAVVELESAAPVVEAAPAPAAAPAPEAGACASQALPLDWLPETSCCISQCRRDRDCDAVCAPFGGQCLQVNSCCRECACFG
jgi:hypothetical protein